MTSETSRYPLARAVRAAYRAGEEDEALEPLVLTDEAGQPLGRIQAGDYVIFYDIRGEREIELTRAFIEPAFDKFPRRLLGVHFTTMIQYHPDLDVDVAFPPLERIGDTLSDVIAAAGLRQIKVCESEKAIHLSYFFNGKKTEPLAGESRVVIPSPHVADYGQAPCLSADGVTEAILAALQDAGAAFIVANYANVDVVGHIENPAAIRCAVETVDSQVGRVVAAAGRAGVTTLITADHGTVERWLYPDGAVDTGHTDSPVPFILVSPDGLGVRPQGELTDVAPTVLQLLGLPRPAAMSGQSLLAGDPPAGRRRVLLLILDGWGSRAETHGNLIAAADTPVMSGLLAGRPSAQLQAAGPAVGMPVGTVGNSEVGHLHLGAGRRLYADRARIDQSIADGSFFENPAFARAVEGAKRDGRRLHLLGIISFYSSHGSVEHLKALLQLAQRRGAPEVFVHGMLGRRGERPESGALYVEEVEREAERLGVGRVVSVIGRFWSLDREEHWDRIEKTYRWLVEGAGRAVMG